MLDINHSLRIAYYTALNGIEGVPVFYQAVPPTVSPDNYIVFRSITSIDDSTVNSCDLSTTITVEIHTWKDGMNSGLDADLIARQVYDRIYPNPSAVLTIDGAQMVNTRVVNDQTQDFVSQQNRGYISRFITFRHRIFLTSDIS
jgi:hypothetical protein